MEVLGLMNEPYLTQVSVNVVENFIKIYQVFSRPIPFEVRFHNIQHHLILLFAERIEMGN